MKAYIIAIGNSRGIRIPKALLEEANLEHEVELTVEKNQLLVKAVDAPRQGWAAAFKKMAQLGDDVLLDDQGSDWDSTEWQW